MITLTKIFHFEMAHALHHYDGACANIHGHSYRLEVSVRGQQIVDPKHPKNGMIIDYGDLKRIVNQAVVDRLDHALLLSNEVDPHLLETLKTHYDNIVVVAYQPTNENLLLDFSTKIQALLPANVILHKIRLYETASSFAEWLESGFQFVKPN